MIAFAYMSNMAQTTGLLGRKLLQLKHCCSGFETGVIGTPRLLALVVMPHSQPLRCAAGGLDMTVARERTC